MKHTKAGCPTWRKCLCTMKTNYNKFDCCGWYCRRCGGHIEDPVEHDEKIRKLNEKMPV